MKDELRDLLHKTLIEGLTPELKAAIDAALAAGATREAIIQRVRDQIGDRLTMSAVEAYLKSKAPVSAKFTLGKLFVTRPCMQALLAAGQGPGDFLTRHRIGDWGDLDDEDAACNEGALIEGSRLFSVYHTKTHVKLYVITEAVDDNGQRSATTLLLPDEY